MTIDVNGDKELREVTRHVEDEEERVADVIVGDELVSLKEDKSRINRIDEDGKDGVGQAGQGIMQVAQQQSQGSVVHWESFLHLRSIKVLLVENDDSTRHVLTALLRNGNYEVIEAANGLQAWKILEDLTNHINLVLTEVVMPCLSGFGLLCKIMNHKTRKNIPVIMMSSHDSMGLVFKCLSKGSVDFLVKPIRKNELRNLWQHVWRRCHSSCGSGSGSESGTQTQKSVKSNSSVKSDNNSGSSDEYDNGSTGLNVGDGSEDGSGTQSSWIKHGVEVDCSQAVSPWDQIADFPDSTCAQVISTNAEISFNKWVPMTATREFQEKEEQLDNRAKGKELVIGQPRNFESQHDSPIEVLIKIVGTKQTEVNSTPNTLRVDKGPTDTCGENPSSKHKAVMSNIPEPQRDSVEFEGLRQPAKTLEINKDIDDAKGLPIVELSLKRLRGVSDTAEAIQSDRNVLRCSDLSAFSRYNVTSNTFKASNGIAGSSSLLDKSLEIVNKESVCDIQSHSKGNLICQSSNGVDNNRDIGSTTSKLSTKPVFSKDELEATSTINGLHLSSDLKPTENDLRCPPQQVTLVKADDMKSTTMLALPGGSRQELPIHHIHHHHHIHHFHNMERHPVSNFDDLSLKKFAADAPHCGSSNMLGAPVEGSPVNHSLNGIASGSKHGSDRQNGSSTVVNAGGTNLESDVGLAGKNGNGDASGSGSGNNIDQKTNAQREAALTKFCQKRKDRCLRKKV